MKTLITLLGLLFASPSWAAITYVTGAAAQYTVSNAPVVGAGSQVTGNQGVACVLMDHSGSSPTVTSMTDTAGSTWTYRDGATNASNVRAEIWTSDNVLGDAVDVTANLSASVDVGFGVVFWSGVAAMGSHTNGTGNDTTPTLSITTQDANNYTVLCGGFRSGTAHYWSAGTGNLRQNRDTSGVSAAGYAIVDNTSASPGSTTTSAVIDATFQWAAAAVELRSTASSGRRSIAPIILQ